MAELTNKVIIITGASAGIGAATALALAPHRVKLILAARRLDKLQAVAGQCQTLGSEAIALPCDVAKRPDNHALITAALEKFQRLDIMIANAGFGFKAAVHETTEAEFDEIYRVNLLGTWFAMIEAAQPMLQQKSGHIVVVSSAAARRGLPLFGPYAMTKAGQLSLAEAMRVELSGTGVHVSSVHPYTTSTEFFDVATQRSKSRVGGLGGQAQTPQTVAQKIVKLLQHPTRRELWPYPILRPLLAIGAVFPSLADYIMKKQIPRRNRVH